MADQKITDFTALTAVVPADIIPIVDDIGGTPVTKKASVQDICQDLDWAQTYADSASGTQALSATTWTAIDQFEATTGAVAVTIASDFNSHTLTNAGWYQVSYNISFVMSSAGTAVLFEFRPYWNSVAQTQGRTSVTCDQNLRYTVSGSCLVDATSGGASLELYVYAATAEDFDVKDMSLLSKKISHT